MGRSREGLEGWMGGGWMRGGWMGGTLRGEGREELEGWGGAGGSWRAGAAEERAGGGVVRGWLRGVCGGGWGGVSCREPGEKGSKEGEEKQDGVPWGTASLSLSGPHVRTRAPLPSPSPAPPSLSQKCPPDVRGLPPRPRVPRGAAPASAESAVGPSPFPRWVRGGFFCFFLSPPPSFLLSA